MFGPVGTTPYDLHFRLFGIPVTVTAWFWLAGLLTSGVGGEVHVDLILIWVGCLFVSILVHEMGHALTALFFGWPPEVYLYGFGGLAVFRPTYGRTTGRSVLISFMGPGAGFLLYGVTLAAEYALIASGWPQTLSREELFRLEVFLGDMEFINLWWGVVNLLPVLPLDGGRIAETLLVRFRPWDGPRLVITLSVVVAGVVAVFFLLNRERFGLYPAALFGLLAFSNLQSMQTRSPW
jgi:stage IV sporulation protein FB